MNLPVCTKPAAQVAAAPVSTTNRPASCR